MKKEATTKEINKYTLKSTDDRHFIIMCAGKEVRQIWKEVPYAFNKVREIIDELNKPTTNLCETCEHDLVVCNGLPLFGTAPTKDNVYKCNGWW